MSIKLMAQVWERKLSKAEQSVLLAMADHAQDDGSRCYPSVDWIAWKTDYSARQVQRTIKELCARGVLLVVRGYGRGRPVEYRIVLSKTEAKPEYMPKGDTASPQSKKGDIVSGNVQKGDMVSPQTDVKPSIKGDIGDVKGDIHAIKGDIAMSPEPLEPLIEPTEEKKEDAASAAPPDDETWVAFLEAFCWVCHGHKDIGALTKEQKGALTSEAKRVRDKGYTIDDLRDWFRDVWQHDWRWTKNKQHERPRPADVRSMIPILRDTEPSTSGYQVDIPDVEFMPGVHPLQPAPNGHSPPLAPMPTGDPWAIALPELLQTLTGSAPLWLAGSRLESNGELAEVPFYRLIVMQPGADTGWLTRQAGPTIRRKLANILRKPIELDIVHESRLTP